MTVVLRSVCNLRVRTYYLRCLFQIPQYIHNQHSLLGFVYLGCKQRRLGGVLVHGVAHDVAGVAGEALHGGAVEAAAGALGGLHGPRGAGHVGRGGAAIGHVQRKGIVAGGGAALGSLAETRPAIGEPNLRRDKL